MERFNKISVWGLICILGTLFVSFLTISCEKAPDPSIKDIRYYSYDLLGGHQKALAGNYPKDSIKVYVYKEEPSLDGTLVHFDVASGGGSVDKVQSVTNQFGYASTKWKFGNTSTEQILNISIYKQSGEFIGELQCVGYSLIYNQWNRIKSYTETSFNSVVRDTINNVTLATNNYNLFKQGNTFINWDILPFIGNKRISTVAIDNVGIVYIATQYGLVYKSIDYGENWIMCTKPFSEFFDCLILKITKDGTLWVSNLYNQLSCSYDGGTTWNLVNLPPSTTLKHICKLNDGTLILLGNLSLYRSNDNGNTWTNLNAPPALSLYVNDNENIILIGLNSMNKIMLSTDKGNNFTTVFSAASSYSSSTIPNQDIYKISGTYYILIQGYGIVTTKDFINFNNYWINQQVEHLFIDHNGTFIVTENEHNYVNYYPFN